MESASVDCVIAGCSCRNLIATQEFFNPSIVDIMDIVNSYCGRWLLYLIELHCFAKRSRLTASEFLTEAAQPQKTNEPIDRDHIRFLIIKFIIVSVALVFTLILIYRNCDHKELWGYKMWYDSRYIISLGLFCNVIGVIILAFFVHYITVMGGGSIPKRKFNHYLGWILNILGFTLQIVGLWLKGL